MTRIIAGRFRARRLTVPDGKDIRPTTDRMRERLFSILGHNKYPALTGARVADLFAGTGALGLEALSRGAAHATFVEQSPGSLNCLRSNIKALQVESETTVVAANATKVARTEQPFDFIFLDPPYRQNLLSPSLSSMLEMGWVNDETAIVCELASDETTEIPPGLQIVDDRKQGKQRLLILKHASADQ